MRLKQQGFCARIARRPKHKPKHAEGEALIAAMRSVLGVDESGKREEA